MNKLVALPIAQLVSDVAVDPVHVRELADSIKVSGPISPVLVREDTSELIDGFHRVAAMKELGFSEVECILTPCDDEAFWDLRIISASTHKAVTFARVMDWIDEVFRLSPGMQRYKGSYKSAFSLFNVVDRGTAPEEVKTWANSKAQKWGLGISTIRQWLYTRQSLAPDLLAEVKSQGSTVEHRDLPFTHYYRVAETLSGQPELQKQVIEKAKEGGLSAEQTREIARAVRQAPNVEEARVILSQPISRTAEDLTRAAKVEKLLREPAVRPTPTERRYQLSGLALEVYLDLQQQVHNVRRLRPEVLETLSSSQKDELLQVVDDLMEELRRVADSLRGVLETRAIEGRET